MKRMNMEYRTKSVAMLLLSCCCLLSCLRPMAQDLAARLGRKAGELASDPQLTYAVIGIHVADAATGRTVFERNGRAGLLPASSQKVLTAAAALDLLGPEFRYTTKFGYTGQVAGGVLQGGLTVEGDGDPTLGSDRYRQSAPAMLEAALKDAMRKAGIREVRGGMTGHVPGFEKATIPRGWLWEDIGNYYGAGHGGLNWHENQYELWLRPGAREGDPVAISRTDPQLGGVVFDNELLSGKSGSGDEAYLYFKPGSPELVVRGSVPCCTGTFRIAGAVLDPVLFTLRQLQRLTGTEGPVEAFHRKEALDARAPRELYTHRSPALDSIVYWFLQRSVNLYGEAILHSLSLKADGKASFESGAERLRDFWAQRGIDREALRIVDGSGLSPQNRVTAEGLVRALLHARQRPWFPAFDKAMPVHNGIRMKSGSMGGVRSYAGYLKSGSGREYVFAVIVNNFSGPGAAVNRKLWSFLDTLK